MKENHRSPGSVIQTLVVSGIKLTSLLSTI